MDVDVGAFLERQGVNNVEERGDEVAYSCPFDGHSHGDSNPSATMHKESTGFFCFGCGKQGNAITFLAELEGIPPHRAKRYIREEFNAPKHFEGPVRDEVERILSRKKGPRQQVFLDEEEIEKRRIDWRAAEIAMMAGELQGENPLTYM